MPQTGHMHSNIFFNIPALCSWGLLFPYLIICSRFQLLSCHLCGTSFNCSMCMGYGNGQSRQCLCSHEACKLVDCNLAGEDKNQINKEINTIWYIYTTKYHSALKRKGIWQYATKWKNLENIMLSEINQSQWDKYCMIPLIWGT